MTFVHEKMQFVHFFYKTLILCYDVEEEKWQEICRRGEQDGKGKELFFT